MKKMLIILGCMSLGMAHAQSNPAPQKVETNVTKRLGINTPAPQASMEIKELLDNGVPIDARIQGLSLPNFTTEQRNKFGEGQAESMKIGTLIYNTSKKCVEMYLGYYNGAHQWSCDLSGGNATNNTTGGTNTNPSTGGGTNEGRTGFYVVEAGFEGVYKQGQELNTTPYRYVNFKLKNNSLTEHRNLDLSNAVTLENGGTISVVPGQNRSVTLRPGDDLVLKYRVQGTVTTGTLVAKFNSQPNLLAEQKKDIFPVGTCRIPYYSCGTTNRLVEMSIDECKAEFSKEKSEYGTYKWFLDGKLMWEEEKVAPEGYIRYSAC